MVLWVEPGVDNGALIRQERKIRHAAEGLSGALLEAVVASRNGQFKPMHQALREARETFGGLIHEILAMYDLQAATGGENPGTEDEFT